MLALAVAWAGPAGAVDCVQTARDSNGLRTYHLLFDLDGTGCRGGGFNVNPGRDYVYIQVPQNGVPKFGRMSYGAASHFTVLLSRTRGGGKYSFPRSDLEQLTAPREITAPQNLGYGTQRVYRLEARFFEVPFVFEIAVVRSQGPRIDVPVARYFRLPVQLPPPPPSIPPHGTFKEFQQAVLGGRAPASIMDLHVSYSLARRYLRRDAYTRAVQVCDPGHRAYFAKCRHVSVAIQNRAVYNCARMQANLRRPDPSMRDLGEALLYGVFRMMGLPRASRRGCGEMRSVFE